MEEVLYNEKAINMKYKGSVMKKRLFVIINICLLLCMLMGCSVRQKTTTAPTLQTEEKSGNVSEEEKTPVTEDIAVVLSLDTKNKIISLQSVTTGEKQILTYTGGCDIRDKYGEVISITQIETGEIVDFSYVASKKKMYSMTVSNTAWKYKDVRNLVIDELENTMSIAEDKYQFSNMLVILSEDEKAMLMDINSADTLILRGIGKQVCSVVIDKGHGYVKLENEDYFIDGFVEIGQEAVKPVTKDMMLVVPEGNYTMYISKNGVGGSKSITVNRNEEIVVDVGDLKGAEIQQGGVKFNITPEEAKLYIDGTEMAHDELITLKYGEHRIKITAENFETYSGTLKVREILKELDISLESSENSDTTPTVTPTGTVSPTITGEATVTPEGTVTPVPTENTTPTVTQSPTVTPKVDVILPGEDGTDTTISDEASQDEENTTSQTTSTGSAKIYVTAPSSAEVYLDGNYMGLVPISFSKTSGTHTITLRQEGYQTKSYTVNVTDDNEDTTYTFSDMVANDD